MKDLIKKMRICLLFVLVLILTACSDASGVIEDAKDKVEEAKDKVEEAKDTVESAKETYNDVVETVDEVKEQVAETKEDIENVKDAVDDLSSAVDSLGEGGSDLISILSRDVISLEMLTKFVEYDSSLNGMELLENIHYTGYEVDLSDYGKFIQSYQINQLGEGQVSYIEDQEGNIKTAFLENGKVVTVITLNKNNVDYTYQYREGEAEGTLVVYPTSQEDYDYNDVQLMTIDPSMYFDTYTSKLLVAEVREYNGSETIYVESENNSLGLIYKAWYSPALTVPLKFETYSGDLLLESEEVIVYEFRKVIRDSYFDLPDDVNFVEVDN